METASLGVKKQQQQKKTAASLKKLENAKFFVDERVNTLPDSSMGLFSH